MEHVENSLICATRNHYRVCMVRMTLGISPHLKSGSKKNIAKSSNSFHLVSVVKAPLGIYLPSGKLPYGHYASTKIVAEIAA